MGKHTSSPSHSHFRQPKPNFNNNDDEQELPCPRHGRGPRRRLHACPGRRPNQGRLDQVHDGVVDEEPVPPGRRPPNPQPGHLCIHRGIEPVDRGLGQLGKKAPDRVNSWFDEGDALQVQCRVSWRNECPDGCVLEHINMTLGQRMSVEWLKRQLVREATLRVAKTSSAERSELAACVMASEDIEVALGGCPLGDDAQMLQDLEVETEATLEVVIDYETLRSKVETIEASRKQEAEAEAEKQRRKEEQERKVREKAERRRTERQQRKAREDARRRHEARYWDAAIRRRQH